MGVLPWSNPDARLWGFRPEADEFTTTYQKASLAWHITAPFSMSAPTFASLGLSPSLAQACAQAGYTTPSPIQVEAIPPLLRGQDLLGLAPTGSA